MNEWDQSLRELIVAARDQLETDTRRALITQTWRMDLPTFPRDGESIELRKPPVQSIAKVDYIDTEGVSQEWNASNYDLVQMPPPGLLIPKAEYPATQEVHNAVQITFLAGYGDSYLNMPGLVTHCMKLLVTMQFTENESGAYGRSSYEALSNRLGWGGYP